ncbi:MAG: HIT domain-containing protein [Chloroflexota bacterium]
MIDDFYCSEVLSGRISVSIVIETPNVLSFHHTTPSYPVHIVVIPKRHIKSLIDISDDDHGLLLELLSVIRDVTAAVVADRGASRVITNVGEYQEAKHLHWHIVAGDQLG